MFIKVLQNGGEEGKKTITRSKPLSERKQHGKKAFNSLYIKGI